MAYDIREPKRLRQVHKAMKGFGYALQYSVFICDLDASERVGMKAAVGELINHGEDSVAVVDIGDAETRGVESFEFMGTSRGLPRGGPQVF